MKYELAESNIIAFDDSSVNLKLLEDMLRKHGFRVCAFPRGRLVNVGQKTGFFFHDSKSTFNPITSAIHYRKINADDESLKNDIVSIEKSVRKIIQMTQEICGISVGKVSMNLQLTNISEFLVKFIIGCGYNTIKYLRFFNLKTV